MTHYINFEDKSPARVTTYPCLSLPVQLFSDDPNVLSQIVTTFNRWLEIRQRARIRQRKPLYTYDENSSNLIAYARTIL